MILRKSLFKKAKKTLATLLLAANAQAATVVPGHLQTWLDSHELTKEQLTIDSDGDGFSNLEEYAFGLHPFENNSDSKPSIIVNAENTLFEYKTRNDLATGVLVEAVKTDFEGNNILLSNPAIESTSTHNILTYVEPTQSGYFYFVKVSLPENQPPGLNINSISATEGQSFSFDLKPFKFDPEGDSFTISANGGNLTYNLNGDTLNVEHPGEQVFGEGYFVNLDLNDGFNTQLHRIEIPFAEVDDPVRLIGAIQNITFSEPGTMIEIPLGDVRVDPDSSLNDELLAFDGTSSGLTYLDGGNFLKVTTPTNPADEYSLVVKSTSIDNPAHTVTTPSFKLLYSSVENQAPTVNISDYTILEEPSGDENIRDLKTMISDDQTPLENLLITDNGSDIPISILPGNFIRYDVDGNENGTKEVRLSISDGEKATDHTHLLNITPVNDPPEFLQDAYADSTVPYNGTHSFGKKAVEYDGESVAYKLVRASDLSELTNWSFSQSGSKIDVQPPTGYAGIETVVMQGTDESGLKGYSNSFTVETLENQAPNVNITDYTVLEEPGEGENERELEGMINDENVSFESLVITDAGSDVDITILPGNKIRYDVDGDENGEKTIRLEVSDNDPHNPKVTYHEHKLNLIPVNDVPTRVGSSPNQIILEDNSLVIDAKPLFFDKEGFESYALNGVLNANVSQNNGVFTITPFSNWNGTIAGMYFEATDLGGLKIAQNLWDLLVNPDNDSPENLSNYPNKTGDQYILDLSRQRDIDSVITQVLKQSNGNDLPAGWTTQIQGESMIVTPPSSFSGSLSVKMQASDLEYTIFSNVFNLSKTGPQTVDVLFNFKKGTDDTNITSGLVTLEYRELPSGAQQSVSDTDGDILLSLKAGVNYEIQGLWDQSVMTTFPFIDGNYLTFFRDNATGEHLEQRARDDTSSIMSFSANGTVNVYKVHKDFPFWDMATMTGSDGTAKFTNPIVPVWNNLNYEGITQEQREWLDEWMADIESTPFVNIDLVYQEGIEIPTESQRLEIRRDSTFAGPTNGTSHVNGVISLGSANYPISISEGTFKVEVTQALKINDIGGNTPPIFNGDGSLNTLGKSVVSLVYLGNPATKY